MCKHALERGLIVFEEFISTFWASVNEERTEHSQSNTIRLWINCKKTLGLNSALRNLYSGTNLHSKPPPPKLTEPSRETPD